ncbi:unnamed protein product [Echinostoma caproni]|uniref:BTB/POZ domain-containing protein n=1 Tax=Echinostoma caproni TaxID=27848 RepID=A0A183ARR9_9TREM|nr:unnamed protein product [Echinostoma caproni]
MTMAAAAARVDALAEEMTDTKKNLPARPACKAGSIVVDMGLFYLKWESFMRILAPRAVVKNVVGVVGGGWQDQVTSPLVIELHGSDCDKWSAEVFVMNFIRCGLLRLL